jgi:hypothetical protein
LGIQPEGKSDVALDQFTLTVEPLGPSTFDGIPKGADLDLVEKAGGMPDTAYRWKPFPPSEPGEPQADAANRLVQAITLPAYLPFEIEFTTKVL